MIVSLCERNISFFTILAQRCTNPERQVAGTTEFCRLAPNISGSSVWNLLLVPRILRSLLDFWTICATLL